MPDTGLENSDRSLRFQAAARLKQARRRAGYKSGRVFAEAAGFNVTTVLHHENGTRSFTSDQAAEYARYLGVHPSWIMFGETSQERGVCHIVGSVEGNASVKLFAARKGYNIVQVPSLDEDYEILVVMDGSMEPFAGEGDLIYFKTAHPLPHFDRRSIDGGYCVVYPEGGTPLVRRVVMQSPTTVALMALDGQPMLINVKVQRIAPIDWVRKRHTLPQALDKKVFVAHSYDGDAAPEIEQDALPLLLPDERIAAA